MLAGLSATIVDGATVSEADLASNFFLDEGDIGKNRAAAVLPRVQVTTTTPTTNRTKQRLHNARPRGPVHAS